MKTLKFLFLVAALSGAAEARCFKFIDSFPTEISGTKIWHPDSSPAKICYYHNAISFSGKEKWMIEFEDSAPYGIFYGYRQSLGRCGPDFCRIVHETNGRIATVTGEETRLLGIDFEFSVKADTKTGTLSIKDASGNKTSYAIEQLIN